MKQYTSRVIAGIGGGLIVAFLGSIYLLFVIASLEQITNDSVVLIGFFVLLVLSLFIAVKSRSARRAWRTLLFLSSALSFAALPLSIIAFILSAQMMSESTDGLSQLSAGFLGIFALIAGFFGLLLGAVFLWLGKVVGRGDVAAHTSPPQQAPLPTEKPDS